MIKEKKSKYVSEIGRMIEYAGRKKERTIEYTAEKKRVKSNIRVR